MDADGGSGIEGEDDMDEDEDNRFSPPCQL